MARQYSEGPDEGLTKHLCYSPLAMTVERDEFGFDAPAPLGHPGRLGLPDGHATGPEIGDALPDFALPDAAGDIVRLHEDRAGARAVVVFFRSAVW